MHGHFPGMENTQGLRPVMTSKLGSSSDNYSGQKSRLPGNCEEVGNRKREIRLIKNREAARECRRKKKEYIKCLENRVAVLENQNKALIEELKNLNDLYFGRSQVRPPNK